MAQLRSGSSNTRRIDRQAEERHVKPAEVRIIDDTKRWMATLRAGGTNAGIAPTDIALLHLNTSPQIFSSSKIGSKTPAILDTRVGRIATSSWSEQRKEEDMNDNLRSGILGVSLTARKQIPSAWPSTAYVGYYRATI
jgi:hypothetical protein